MKTNNILILGGAGFIGSHLVARLASEMRDVTVVVRRRARARHLIPLPNVEVLEADALDPTALLRLVQGREAVINLIGVLHSDYADPWGKRFDRVHVQLPRQLAEVCRQAGVPHLIHVSALGADLQGPSMYARSRAAGEQAVQQALEGSQTAWTILRPSVVFGPEDQFLNMFARLARFAPVLPMARDRARLQPIYVHDVVQALMACLDRPQTHGKVYPLAGPEAFELGQLAEMASAWAGHKRTVVSLPVFLGELQAAIFECLPGEPLMSRDNLDTLKVDNVWPEPPAPELGVQLTPIEAVAPHWLSGQHRRADLFSARMHARRRA